ncbi:hypothetical protein K3495_g15136 [Podosphaera aphanis]|nr:hypothetical protein K3495_g15136 [Podosphaera aphanis]
MNESDMETTLKVGGNGSQRIFRPSRLPLSLCFDQGKEFSPAYRLAYPQAKRHLCGPAVVDESEELDDSDDENLPDYSERLVTLFDDLKDLFHEQKGINEFLKRLAEGNLRNFALLDETKHLKAQRSMSKTWSSRKHSELLFYKRKES